MDMKANAEDKKSLMVCPFCKGRFTSLPDEVTIFDCSFCKNRLYLKKLAPAMSWNMLFSSHALHIFHIYMARPEALMSRRIVSYSEVWKENRQNLVIVSQMSFLGAVYAAFAIYMEQHGSNSIVFTNPFFSSIPLAIAVWYYIVYILQSRKFLVNPIPVIEPEAEDRQGIEVRRLKTEK